MENWLVPWPRALKTILLHYSWSPGKFYKLNFKFECSNADSNIYSIACFDTVLFEIPYINKLWICFDFHFCIFSCKRSIEKEYIYIIWKCFFFSWEARNGGIILTREPEIIIVTYIYVPWAPQHICCDVYIRPVGFKGLIRLLTKGWMVSHTNMPMVEFSDKVQLMYLVPADLNAMSRNLCKRLKQQPVGSSEI